MSNQVEIPKTMRAWEVTTPCLLYTSDAADEL